ncbi:uncharacterized protein JCM15063_005293 [Sporobolomyces koalae]|uniref:uncharacterized protein n=1 Tax=Sporobolomyces koalae TaxID=500713 RepID=UPI003177832D
MAFSDLFSVASTASSTSEPTPMDLASRIEKDALIRNLVHDLLTIRQENERLEQSHKTAVADKKDAVGRVRELQDALQMKEGILDALEKRIEALETENHRLLSVETELSLLRQDQLSHPLSSTDAEHRYSNLSTVFSQLRDTLSCAICYEPFVRSQATSLLCGHSFCRTCFTEWEQRHVEAWKLNPHQRGVYPGAECPECRSQDVRRGKVRIWALEETIRLVDRAVRDIEHDQFTPQAAVTVEPRPRDSARESQGPSAAIEEQDRPTSVSPTQVAPLIPDSAPTSPDRSSELNTQDLVAETVETVFPVDSDVSSVGITDFDSPMPVVTTEAEVETVQELRPRTPNPYIAVFQR